MKRIKGFTLIEMLVIIGSIGIALPALFSIIYNILQQQTKIYRLTDVKRQGDYILNNVENIIRNYAVSIHSLTPTPPISSSKICQQLNKQIFDGYFLDKFGSYFRFCKSSNGTNCDNGNNYVASFSSILSPNTVSLNNNKVKITDFSLSCYKTNAYSTPVVEISFTISYNTTSTRPEDKAQMTYQTKVKLRNY